MVLKLCATSAKCERAVFPGLCGTSNASFAIVLMSVSKTHLGVMGALCTLCLLGLHLLALRCALGRLLDLFLSGCICCLQCFHLHLSGDPSVDLRRFVSCTVRVQISASGNAGSFHSHGHFVQTTTEFVSAQLPPATVQTLDSSLIAPGFNVS